MEFSARTDIEAPIDFVFGQVTDFAGFERSIMRRGGDVERVEGGGAAIVGTKWNVKFRLRGKERKVKAEIVSVDAPNNMNIAINSPNLKGSTVVELVALSKGRTRLIVTVEAAAKSIPAKLLFQSVRFARGRTQKRFDTLVTGFAEDVEARYKA